MVEGNRCRSARLTSRPERPISGLNSHRRALMFVRSGFVALLQGVIHLMCISKNKDWETPTWCRYGG